MRRPPTSDILTALLAGLLSVPLLGAEVGHSLAHHHAAHHQGTAQHSIPGHHAAGDVAEQALTDHQHDGDHPHLSIATTLLTKPSLQDLHAVVVAPVVPLHSDRRLLVALSPAVGPPPGGRPQVFPPPSRAPPQV